MAVGKDVRVIRFWTDYVSRGGKLVPVDKVEIAAVGQASRTSTPMPVSWLSKCRPPTGPDDIAALMSNDIWNQVKPHYDAWKQGNAVTVEGTPLGAWPGVTPEQVTVLKANGFRTVEEISQASDGALVRIQLPNARNLVEQAKAFLAAADQGKLATELASRDAEIARLREGQEEMARMMKELLADRDKPRRGRPPKSASEDDMEAVA